MVGWLRRMFRGKPVAAAAPMGVTTAVPSVEPPAPPPTPPPPPYVPNQPNLAGLAAQALSATSRPPPEPEPEPPASAMAALPAAPGLVLGAEERLLLLQVARGTARRARPAVAAALQGITGDRPDLNRVPNRGQLARALHRLRRDPAKVAALLEQVDVLAGAARRR